VRKLRADLGLSRERFGRLLDVSAKTVERWEAQGALPSGQMVRQRLAQLGEIAELGLIVYPPEVFRQLLASPAPRFGGHTALQLVELGQGERVLGALAADYEGLGY
jgi:transcriptional regulator with XRE-family HTH domain